MLEVATFGLIADRLKVSSLSTLFLTLSALCFNWNCLLLAFQFTGQLSRRSWLVLAVLAGISVSLAAGFLLSRRRRRYRAISATSLDARDVRSGGGRGSTLSRSSTFGRESEDRDERRGSRYRRRRRHRTADDEMTGEHWSD